MHGTTSGGSTTYEKLVCISEFPDLGSEPETIDVTTLCDTIRKYIPGVQDTGALNFTAFYTSAAYSTLKALEGTTTDFAVWFGGTGDGETSTPTGSEGKFNFSGQLSVFVNGGGVNDPVQMTISILPSTEITLAA